MNIYLLTTILFAVLWLIAHVRYKKASGEIEWKEQLAQFAIDKAMIEKHKFEISEKYFYKTSEMHDRHYNRLVDMATDGIERMCASFEKALEEMRDDWE